MTDLFRTPPPPFEPQDFAALNVIGWNLKESQGEWALLTSQQQTDMDRMLKIPWGKPQNTLEFVVELLNPPPPPPPKVTKRKEGGLTITTQEPPPPIAVFKWTTSEATLKRNIKAALDLVPHNTSVTICIRHKETNMFRTGTLMIAFITKNNLSTFMVFAPHDLLKKVVL